MVGPRPVALIRAPCRCGDALYRHHRRADALAAWRQGNDSALALGVLLLPLAASAITGMLYRAGQAWFGLSEDTAHLLMTIHEGGWLGRDLKVYYSVTLGSGSLALGFFGLALLRPVERSLNCATSGQKLKKVPTRNATRIERGAVGPRDVDLGPHAPSRDPPP